ncbi:hypothetical protein ACWCSH_47075, partial [Streptosporangium sp. NPDC001682]
SLLSVSPTVPTSGSAAREDSSPAHTEEHIVTMARLHRQNRYDRMTGDVESITGRPATTVREFVAERAALFTRRPR